MAERVAHRVCVLFGGSPDKDGKPQPHHQEHVIDKLKKLGHQVEFHYYDNLPHDERPEATRGWCAGVDVILAGDTESAIAARENADDSIPIVVATTGDPGSVTGSVWP